MKAKKPMNKEEMCRAVIALAQLVIAERYGRDIYFVNEETKERIRHDNNER